MSPIRRCCSLALVVALAACAEPTPAGIPAQNRIPDAGVKVIADQCVATDNKAFSPALKARLCDCMARRWADTISAKDTMDLGLAAESMSKDQKMLFVIKDKRFLNIITTCAAELSAKS